MGRRVFLIVLDGVGAGELPDAADYRDRGSNTLGNLSRAAGGLTLPALQRLGLGNILEVEGVPAAEAPLASWGRMAELSKGKDTITGHWEMMGIVMETPFPTYPEGFPREVIREFETRIGRRVIWNKPASGTEIIRLLGEEHMRSARPIVYTSADSVFQVAAHEEVIPVEELYRICETARAVLVAPHNVCRVIARPFTGPPFERTHRRRDFALPPPSETLPDRLKEKGVEVISVGKVADMFCGRGFTGGVKTAGNRSATDAIDALAGTLREGLVFANLVDFDMLYGHRNDVRGFAGALEEFDSWLGGFLPGLGNDDYLFITADHGLDPTTPGTDHSREYVPLLFHNSRLPARELGTRRGFRDVGRTIADIFGVARFPGGESLLPPP
jgi:phosphopentomutase